MTPGRALAVRARRVLAVTGMLLLSLWGQAGAAEQHVLLVKFHPGIESSVARTVIDQSGAQSTAPLSPHAPPGSASSRWWRVIYPTAEQLQHAAAQLAGDPAVERLERPQPVTTY